MKTPQSQIGFTTDNQSTPAPPIPSALPEPIESHPLAIDIYLIVTVAIATALILCVLGAVVLAIFSIPVPELLGQIAMAALVALAALLRGESN